MTVEIETNKVREDGNGSKTAFDFTFPVLDETHLEVYKVVKSTGVATLQTLNTDYTVALNSSSPGGTVTYVTAPSALEESFISRVNPITQETDIPETGSLREPQVENELDNCRMIDQQLQEQIDRCPKLSLTSELSDLEIPTPEAGTYLGWNADANALENKAAPTAVDYAGNIDFGNDADKAISPAQGDVFVALDVRKLYVCFSSGTWTWYDPSSMTTRGDLEFYGSSGKTRLPAGTSGYFLKTLGSSLDPVWAQPSIGGSVGSGKNIKVTRGSVTQVTITADELCLEDSSNNKTTIRSVNVTAAITTTGANGLMSGLVEGNKWYYIWVIRKSSDGTVGCILTESSTTISTLPSGYDQYALVSAVYNNSGNDFVNFKQYGKKYKYVVWPLAKSGAPGAAAWESISLAAYVPSGLSEIVVGSVGAPGSHTLAITNDSSVAIGSTGAPNKIVASDNTLATTSPFELDILTADTIYWLSDASGYVYISGFEITKI